MTSTYAIEIKLVSQVENVELEIDVLRNRVRRHRIESPVVIHKTRVDGVAEATADKSRAATEVNTGWQTIRGPYVERIPRRVDECLSNFRGNV